MSIAVNSHPSLIAYVFASVHVGGLDRRLWVDVESLGGYTPERW
ncbi:MAG: hypothetical protein ACI9D5_000753 [Candidatus Endobugula sp.]|jgi:hypothetical protein